MEENKELESLKAEAYDLIMIIQEASFKLQQVNQKMMELGKTNILEVK